MGMNDVISFQMKRREQSYGLTSALSEEEDHLHDRVSFLLRHPTGASLEELRTITRAKGFDVIRAIRRIVDLGGQVTLHDDGIRGRVFYLVD